MIVLFLYTSISMSTIGDICFDYDFRQLSASSVVHELDNEKSHAALIYKKCDFSNLEELTEIDSSGLIEIFDILYFLNSASPDKLYVEKKLLVFNALAAREKITRWHVLKLHEGLVRFRMFAEAKKLSQDFSDDFVLSESPKVSFNKEVDEDGRKVYRLASRSDTWEPFSVDIDNKSRGYVVMHPNCRFSKRAINLLFADEQLKRFFKENMTFILPQAGSMETKLIAKWQERFDARVFHINNSQDWPEIDIWQTPVFVFFDEHGKHHKVIGWPSDTQIEVIRSKIESLNLNQ